MAKSSGTKASETNPFADWAADTTPAKTADGWHTAAGVFSADGIDPGSAELAPTFAGKLKGKVADLGAGWGWLAAQALSTCPDLNHIDLIEAEHAALLCAKPNITDVRAAFHWADANRPTTKNAYDAVISNPPFHTGRKADPALGRAFIQSAATLLKPTGQLAYEATLDASFVRWEVTAHSSRYKIIHARKPKRYPRDLPLAIIGGQNQQRPSSMSFSLEGKTAIITGAANGVGLEVARHFSDHGANVILVDMDESKLQAEADSIDGDGENVRYFAGDLRKKLTVANLLSATIDAFDGIDILINASRKVLPSNPLDQREDHFEELFQQNVLANLRVTQAVAKRMIAQEKKNPSEGGIGAVVNLSSIASDRTHAELLAYSVACAALNQMTRSLAVAFADQRIRVNAIAIGSVMSASLQSRLKNDPDVRAATLAATPLGRIAKAREVAETAQFLATEASGFMTGQIITVDGGRSLIDPLEAAAH